MENVWSPLSALCFVPCAFCHRLGVLPARPAAAGHAILFPRFPVSISRVMESIKVGSTLRKSL